MVADEEAVGAEAEGSWTTAGGGRAAVIFADVDPAWTSSTLLFFSFFFFSFLSEVSADLDGDAFPSGSGAFESSALRFFVFVFTGCFTFATPLELLPALPRPNIASISDIGDENKDVVEERRQRCTTVLNNFLPFPLDRLCVSTPVRPLSTSQAERLDL